MTTPVYLEVGKRRTFACALDWPGWARSGKGEEGALETLAAYGPRYAVVAGEAGVEFPAGSTEVLDVVERLPGTAATDFGVIDGVATADARPLDPNEAERQAELVAASWRVLDRVAASAPEALRKGPRGGGRDRDAIVAHVIAAEVAYARKIGIRHPVRDPSDAEQVEALRSALLDVLSAAREGRPLVDKGWPPRYAARRIAWHVLDHAWEIEDRG